MSNLLYQRVRIISDKYLNEGGRIGDIGYVIEVLEQGVMEVEFSNAFGETLRTLVVDECDLEVAQENASPQ